MYLKQIQIKNTGPIGDFDYSFKFKDGAPKPLILVGKNGSGKSIVLSHIVNGMLIMQAEAYEDVDIKKGKAFKVRSQSYIKIGTNFYFSKVVFDNEFYISEIQLNARKIDFEKVHAFPDVNFPFNEIGSTESSKIYFNLEGYASTLFPSEPMFKKSEITDAYSSSVRLFFPPNRFEEPAWMNADDLVNFAKYTNRKMIEGFSGRTVIKYHPMRENQDWLLERFPV